MTMRALQRLLGVGLIVALALTLTGCPKKKKDDAPEPQGNPLRPDPAGGAPAQGAVKRGAQRVVNQSLLEQFGIYYAAYQTDNGRPPRTLAEFRDYLARDPNARNQVAAIDKDWIVWRLDPAPNANQVLAYEKDEFNLWHNRLVLLGGGAVQMMTTDEFQAALKQ
jgi:hypothetical protein